MVYLDNASTTFPKPECVYVAMDGFYRAQGVNASRGQYKAAAAVEKMIRDTRSQIKDLLGCNAGYEVIFTSTATEAINTILQGIDYTNIRTVYVTAFEHNAVLRTLNFLQKRLCFDIIELAVSYESFGYDIERIKAQFNETPPGLIVATHASNVCGLVAPVEEIASLAKRYNARVVVDMAQTAGLIDLDSTAAGVDAAVFAGHKTLYGPFGVSGFVMKKDLVISPLIYGGVGRDSAETDMPDEPPERFEAGTRNTQAISGLNRALKWISDTSVKSIYNRERVLKQYLAELLSGYKNVKIVGRNDGIGIISCIFDGYAPDDIGNVLDRFGIAVRTGLHCAPGAHKRLGTFPAGTVRFSISYFNNESEINALGEALRYIRDNG